MRSSLAHMPVDRCPRNYRSLNIGSSLSQATPLRRISPDLVAGSRASWNEGREDSSIGRSSFVSNERSDSEGFWMSSVLSTPSPVDRPLPTNTFGRMTPPSLELDLNLGNDLCNEVILQIGTRFERMLSPEDLTKFRPISTLEIMGTCDAYLRTTLNQLLSSGLLRCIGVRQAQASLEGPGKRPVSTLILKILEPSSGMATVVSDTLLSMNSAATSISHMYSDGSTDIRLLLKLKEVRSCCRRPIFG